MAAVESLFFSLFLLPPNSICKYKAHYTIIDQGLKIPGLSKKDPRRENSRVDPCRLVEITSVRQPYDA